MLDEAVLLLVKMQNSSSNAATTTTGKTRRATIAVLQLYFLHCPEEDSHISPPLHEWSISICKIPFEKMVS